MGILWTVIIGFVAQLYLTSATRIFRPCGTPIDVARHLGGLRMSRPTLHQRREENLRAMRSPASIALAVVAIGLMIVATVFHDHAIIDNPVLFTYLREAVNAVQ